MTEEEAHAALRSALHDGVERIIHVAADLPLEALMGTLAVVLSARFTREVAPLERRLLARQFLQLLEASIDTWEEIRQPWEGPRSAPPATC